MCNKVAGSSDAPGGPGAAERGSFAVMRSFEPHRLRPSARAGSLILLATSVGLAGAPAGHAQEIPALSDSARVSLLSILPGDDIYSVFGHSALRITDPVLGIDEAYNFGTFDFGDSPTAMLGFIGRFTYGDLNYRLTVQDPRRMVDYYWQELRRPTVEQTLALAPDERQEMFRLLRINALPENAYYQYDFFFDNCATRLRDVLVAAIGPELSFDAAPPDRSFRRLLDRYLGGARWTDFGMDLGLGLPADRQATAREAAFLPEHLMDFFAAGRLDRGGSAPEPLVTRTVRLTGPADAAWTPEPATPWPALLLWGLLLGGVALTVVDVRARRAGRRVVDGIFFGVLGIAGLAVVFLWFISLHAVTKTNFNLGWALPTHLALAAALVADSSARWIGYYLAATAVLAAVLLAGMPIWPQELPGPAVPLLALITVRAGGLAWVRLAPGRLAPGGRASGQVSPRA